MGKVVPRCAVKLCWDLRISTRVPQGTQLCDGKTAAQREKAGGPRSRSRLVTGLWTPGPACLTHQPFSVISRSRSPPSPGGVVLKLPTSGLQIGSAHLQVWAVMQSGSCQTGWRSCSSVAESCPTPSLSPRVCSNPCPLSQWCYLTISSSITAFSSCPQSFPGSGSFPVGN